MILCLFCCTYHLFSNITPSVDGFSASLTLNFRFTAMELAARTSTDVPVFLPFPQQIEKIGAWFLAFRDICKRFQMSFIVDKILKRANLAFIGLVGEHWPLDKNPYGHDGEEQDPAKFNWDELKLLLVNISAAHAGFIKKEIEEKKFYLQDETIHCALETAMETGVWNAAADYPELLAFLKVKRQLAPPYDKYGGLRSVYNLVEFAYEVTKDALPDLRSSLEHLADSILQAPDISKDEFLNKIDSLESLLLTLQRGGDTTLQTTYLTRFLNVISDHSQHRIREVAKDLLKEEAKITVHLLRDQSLSVLRQPRASTSSSMAMAATGKAPKSEIGRAHV